MCVIMSMENGNHPMPAGLLTVQALQEQKFGSPPQERSLTSEVLAMKQQKVIPNTSQQLQPAAEMRTIIELKVSSS